MVVLIQLAAYLAGLVVLMLAGWLLDKALHPSALRPPGQRLTEHRDRR